MFLLDPYMLLRMKACKNLMNLIKSLPDLFVNSIDIFTKALLTSLTSKKSKERIASLHCLWELLFVSPFKNSYKCMDILIGYQDPNYVKIKSFYEPSWGYNYLAMLVKD